MGDDTQQIQNDLQNGLRDLHTAYNDLYNTKISNLENTLIERDIDIKKQKNTISELESKHSKLNHSYKNIINEFGPAALDFTTNTIHVRNMHNINVTRKQTHTTHTKKNDYVNLKSLYPIIDQNITSDRFNRLLYKLFNAKLFNNNKSSLTDLKKTHASKSFCNDNAINNSLPQELIPLYMHPHSPYHGLLVYHSVGSGKTKVAQDILSNYEQKRRVWITKKKLKDALISTNGDLYKCGKYDFQVDPLKHILVLTFNEANELVRNRIRDQDRSYKPSTKVFPYLFKQMTSFIIKNEILVPDLNIENDPFQGCIIIVDEAHNIINKPVLARVIQGSVYAKSSKVVLLTATPFAFNDVNTAVKLMRILLLPSRYEKFKNNMTHIYRGWTKEYESKILDSLAGVISYYDPRDDARLFAQQNLSDDLIPNKTSLNRIENTYPIRAICYEIDVHDHIQFKPPPAFDISKYKFEKTDEDKYYEQIIKDQYRNKFIKASFNRSIGVSVNSTDAIIALEKMKANNTEINFKTYFDTTIQSIANEVMLDFVSTGQDISRRKTKNRFSMTKSVHSTVVDALIMSNNRSGKHLIYSRLTPGRNSTHYLSGAERFYLSLKSKLRSNPKMMLVENDKEGMNNYKANAGGKTVTVLLKNKNKSSDNNDTTQFFLKQYNHQDNWKGTNIKYIILDSMYNEGISLYDTRYVHILEPPKSFSDMEQIIGRAIRRCGHDNTRQKNQNSLSDKFNSNLNITVYIYRPRFKTDSKFKIKSSYIKIPRDMLSKFKDLFKRASIDDSFYKSNSTVYEVSSEMFKIDEDIRIRYDNIHEKMKIFELDKFIKDPNKQPNGKSKFQQLLGFLGMNNENHSMYNDVVKPFTSKYKESKRWCAKFEGYNIHNKIGLCSNLIHILKDENNVKSFDTFTYPTKLSILHDVPTFEKLKFSLEGSFYKDVFIFAIPSYNDYVKWKVMEPCISDMVNILLIVCITDQSYSVHMLVKNTSSCTHVFYEQYSDVKGLVDTISNIDTFIQQSEDPASILIRRNYYVPISEESYKSSLKRV